MMKVDTYDAYQKQHYEQRTAGQKAGTQKSEKTGNSEQTQGTAQTEQVKTQQKQMQLSDNAKALLEKLKKKYSNMDFFIADYETNEEAQSYLSRGTKEYSVIIDPQLLEDMAADEAVRDKYMGILEGATSKIGELKSDLGDEVENITHIGFTIGKDGTVSYFAELEKLSEKQRERIDRTREEKKAQAKEDKKKAQKVSIQALSIEKLAEKIKNIDWNTVSMEKKTAAGNRIDYSV